jgi:abhydrolase domain-containing protein 6
MKRWLLLIGLLLFAAPTLLFHLLPARAVTLVKWVERGRAGLAEKQVTISDGPHTVRYVERPGSGEPVVFLHGFGGDKDNWVRMAPAFSARDHRLIIPDLPGWGESTRLPALDYSPQRQIDRLEAFFVAIGLERFHLAGNSMGGCIAGLYAAKYPARVQTLTFYDNACVRAEQPSDRDRMEAQGKNVLVVQAPADFDRLLDFVFFKQPFIPSPVRSLLAQRAMAQAAGNQVIFASLTAHRTALEPLLPTLKMPVAIVWGDRDRLLHVSTAQVMARALPSAKLHIMKDCGHSPQLERPSQAAQPMLDLIAGR